MSDRIIWGQNHGAQLDHRGMEVPGGINPAADNGVSAMILSCHDSVPPTFADKLVNAHGPVPSAGGFFKHAVRIVLVLGWREWHSQARRNGLSENYRRATDKC